VVQPPQPDHDGDIGSAERKHKNGDREAHVGREIEVLVAPFDPPQHGGHGPGGRPPIPPMVVQHTLHRYRVGREAAASKEASVLVRSHQESHGVYEGYESEK